MVPPKAQRVAFIDLLRGWAVIVMIETHVVNAKIMPELTESGPFQWLKFLNGLVAPSFLFASGLAYAVTTRRKLQDYLNFGSALSKQFGRLLFLLGVAYLLHVPHFSLDRMLSGLTTADRLVFAQADVLHCIAVSLLILQVLLLVFRTEARTYTVLAVLTLCILLATPFMWGIDFLGLLPTFLAAYMNGLHYSLFPLFPWSVFLFAGVLLGYQYLEARESRGTEEPGGGELRMMKAVLWIGPALVMVSFILDPFARLWYVTYDYWRFSPSFVLLRLGVVLLLCAGLFFFERFRGVSARSPVALMGRESLLVYVVHLFLIYGKFGPFNFQDWSGRQFGYAGAFAWSLVLILAMYGLALAWDRVRRMNPRIKRGIQLATFVIIAAVFVFGPGQ